MTTAFVERLKTAPASIFLPSVPPIPFEVWLFQQLEPYIQLRADRSFAFWSLLFCAERLSAIPSAGPDLCVEVEIPTADRRIVIIAVRMAAGRTVNRQTGWHEIVPTLHKLRIESRDESGLNPLDSLDVASFGDLRQQLALPLEDWPAVDLRSTVRWSPVDPLPGEVVRFTVTVENAGKRDAARAQVDITLRFRSTTKARKRFVAHGFHQFLRENE